MQRFNPEKELKRIQSGKTSKGSRTVVLFIPILIMVCCMVTIITSSYSATNLTTRSKYTIKIDFINGNENSFVKQVYGGKFEETINTDATFGSINCIKGSLSYDENTKKVYAENISEDTTCIISYMNDGTKGIDYNSLGAIEDNDGTSYYYKGDSKNNILLFRGKRYYIIRENGDKTLRLMLMDSIGNYNYGDTNNYGQTTIPTLLENWYNSNFNNDDRLIIKEFDLSNYMEPDINNLKIMNTSAYYRVGLLNINELSLINKGLEKSYIPSNILLSNGHDLNEVWTSSHIIDKTEYAEIHPVINIKYNKLIGQGTEEKPYEIED